MADSVFVQLFHNAGDNIWHFLELKDILNLSVCSRSAAGLTVSADALNNIITKQKFAKETAGGKLGHLSLAFASDLSTGMVRRVMNRVCGGNTAIVTIDDRNGRITLDIGSAFHDNDAFLASEVTPVADDVDVESQQIFKQLEISSYDEYDDFNPRHPMPKERSTHRRGDSYFNSDIDTVVNELSNSNANSNGGDLSSIAKAALLAGDDSSTAKKQSSSSLKDRLLAKSKTGASRPPIPTGRGHLSSPVREPNEDN
jgi:hypothetical protein